MVEMNETPHKISLKIDEIIGGLNNKWDLRLPFLHGSQAQTAEAGDAASRCVLGIRYLCFKSATFEGALEDFDERARAAIAKWRFKPSQEKGTLPILPQTKSFIRRDVLSKQGGILTSQQRERVISILAEVLEEEIKLTKESDVYERTSSRSTTRTSHLDAHKNTSVSRSPSRATSSSTIAAASPTRPLRGSSAMSPRKREGSTCESGTSGKKIKTDGVQSKLDGFFPPTSIARSTRSSSTHMNESIRMAPPSFTTTAPACSFDSTTSQSADQIFTDEEAFPSSNDTSVLLSDYQRNTQDLLPTQEVDEFMNDVSFTSNLDVADGTSFENTSLENRSFYTLPDLINNGPFKRPRTHLPSNLPFWQIWETWRLSSATDRSLWDIHQQISIDCKTTTPSVTDFRQVSKRLQLEARCNKMLPNSDIRHWISENNCYENAKDSKSVYFTANLEIQEDGEFSLRLDAIKIDQSCRFHRQFGADRFMVVSIPYFTADKLPSKVRKGNKNESNAMSNLIIKWLSTQDHHIAGRVWRAFFLEPDKSQSKKKRDEAGYRQKLHLFATDGQDFGHESDMQDFGKKSDSQSRRHEPISIEKFLNWHTPFDANRSSSDLKLFARFGLGLSKTTATIELRPEEFQHVLDKRSDKTGNVMDDGCALMSLELARAIWRECGDPSMSLPSVFQGRIGGAKGLWMVDFYGSRPYKSERSFWIEISDAQLKIKPHPKDRLDADPSQRTFEVLKYSKPCSAGSLNTQLINILEDRGISRSVLEKALLKDLHEYIEAARQAMEDPRRLRAWIQQYHTTDRESGSIVFNGGLPNSRTEEISLLVESGFEPKDCLHLRKLIRSMMTQELDTFVEKLKIKLDHSTHVFCVPDPYGVLEPDEVFLGFSSEWENPKTGLKETALDDIDVIVARNPAHLSSDIQKRKAVYKHELRHFKNVIIFSTKGDIATASMLSGGDYDGDTVVAIWDPEFTSTFENVDKLPDLRKESECGMINQSRRLTQVFPAKKQKPTSPEIDSFLESCMLFNAQSSLLGVCTNEFEKYIYNIGKLSSPGAEILAALAGYLVDSSKQGWYLSESAWFKLRKEACGSIENKIPAYKSGQPPKRRGMTQKSECVNVIDFLKFDVAQQQKDIVLTDLKKSFDDSDSYDKKLSRYYHRENNRCGKDSKDPERVQVAIVLKHLTKALNDIVQQWSLSMTGREDDADNRQFALLVQLTSERVLAVVPPNAADCDIVRDFIWEGGDKNTRWSLLRASTMYYLWPKHTVMWHTVGDEICRLKARSRGVTRELVPDIHHILKADVKLADKLASTAIVN